MFVRVDDDRVPMGTRCCDVSVPVVLWEPPVEREEQGRGDARDDHNAEPCCARIGARPKGMCDSHYPDDNDQPVQLPPALDSDVLASVEGEGKKRRDVAGDYSNRHPEWPVADHTRDCDASERCLEPFVPEQGQSVDGEREEREESHVLVGGHELRLDALLADDSACHDQSQDG